MAKIHLQFLQKLHSEKGELDVVLPCICYFQNSKYSNIKRGDTERTVCAATSDAYNKEIQILIWKLRYKEPYFAYKMSSFCLEEIKRY